MDEADRHRGRTDFSPFRKREKDEFTKVGAQAYVRPLTLTRQEQITLCTNGVLLVPLVVLCRSHELR